MQTLFTETKVAARVTSLVHFAAPYLAFGVGFAASLLLILIVPNAGEQGAVGEIAGLITFTVAGFWIGRVVYKKVPTKAAFLAWMVPAALLTWSAWSWHLSMSQYDSTWDTYFGRNCGGSECLYQLFLTFPFYTSVAYSIGAVSMTRKPGPPNP